MSWYTSGQNDQNIRYWLLDSSHGSYETRRAAIESLSPNYANVAGDVANTRVVTGYATDAEIASNSLDIGGAVLDRVHQYVNPNAAAVSIRTNEWGDKHPVWGEFLQQPQAIPTTGIDRLVAWWKGEGTDSFLYIAQTARGDGSGDSYANAKAIKDILGISGVTPAHEPTNYDGLVFCGRLSRFSNEGPQGTNTSASGFEIKDGSEGSRTLLLSHPADPAELMYGLKLGSGSWTEPSSWTDEGGGMFSLVIGANNGLTGLGFVMSEAGGTLRALTKVASSVLCAATEDSFFIEVDYSGSNDRVYVHLADGSNPKTTTYFSPSVIIGIFPIIAGTTHIDVFGITFYGHSWTGTGHIGASDYCFYACKFAYVNNGNTGRVFACHAGTINETTGSFSYDQPSNRKWIGCTFTYCGVGIYDTNAGHNKVPLNTTIEDNYFVDTNMVAADAYGNNLFSKSDAHAITCQGADGWRVVNNRCHRTGAQVIVPYLQPNRFLTPSGGLENEPLYTDGFVYPTLCFDSNPSQAGTHTYVCRFQNVYIAYNFATEPRVADTNTAPPADSMFIAMNGDSTQLLGLEGQYGNIIVEYNRGEGAFTHALRHKFSYPDGDTDTTIYRYNVIRGAVSGLYNFDSAVAGDPSVSYDPSLRFYGNDIHATAAFVQLINHLNPDHHIQYLDENTYRNDAGANWRRGGGYTYSTLAAFLADQPTGDTYDPNSTHVALYTDTGSPTLTASQAANVLSVSLGADPDGATSNLSYQWFADGELIVDAEATSFNASGYAQGTEFTCVVLGEDAEGKWFLVTSNTVTYMAAEDVYLYTNVELGEVDGSSNVVLLTQQEREDGYPPVVAGGGIGSEGVSLTITYGGVTIFSGIVHPTGGISG